MTLVGDEVIAAMRLHSHRLAARLSLLGFAALAVVRAEQPAQPATLKIVVVQGDAAVNIIQQKTAVAPVVEVRDQNDLPVAGVPVTFTIGGGNTAAFAGGAQTLTVTTNAAGRAVATGFSPVSSGAVQINVTATVQGQTAAASIVQTNYATVQAAQAAGASTGGGGSGGTSASGAAGGGGGGGLSLTTIGIIGGAAAGTYVALKETGVLGESLTEAPIITGVQAFPNPALALATLVDFNFSGEVAGKEGTSWRQFWDFGDGTTTTVTVADGFVPSVERVTHNYNAPGTYTVRLTIANHQDTRTSGETTMTVRDLTGRWRVGTTNNFYDFTQSGSSFTGTFTAAPRTITGTVQSTAPYVSFTETSTPAGTTVVTTFTASFPPTGDTINGVLNGGGFNNSAVVLTRQ